MSYKSKYSKFRFIKWEQRLNELHFHYGFDDELAFTEKLVWPEGTKLPTSLAFHRAADAYHLLAGVSYYKAHLAPVLSLESQKITQKQADFLNETYLNGLGEYLYTNNLDPELIARFNSSTSESQVGRVVGKTPLVLIGGGKDSLTTVNLLQDADKSFETFRVNPQEWVVKQMDEIGAPVRTIKRVLDPGLFEQNAQGALNGHVPITAILSFAAVIQAVVSKNSAIILSNEASASIPNTEYHDLDINHQYSKSMMAEQGLAEYIEQNIASDLEYFSLLRPFTELKIAEYFALNVMSKYPKIWSSSNHNFKIGEITDEAQWDPHSPKSLAVFGMLAAFLPREELLDEVGFDGFNLEAEDTWAELLGISGIKPFECVADIDEMRLALFLAQSSGEWPELTDFDVPEPIVDDYRFLRDHRIPQEYLDVIEDSI